MIVPLRSAAQDNPPASPFRALFDSFIRDFRVENPSQKTIEVYTESARQLEAFLWEHGRPLDPAGIKRGDVADFLNHLQDAGRTPATIRVRFSSLRRFFNWLDRALADGAPARPQDPGQAARGPERG